MTVALILGAVWLAVLALVFRPRRERERVTRWDRERAVHVADDTQTQTPTHGKNVPP